MLKKVVQVWFLFCLVLFVIGPVSVAQERPFAERVILKVSAMLRTAPPTKITVRVVDQNYMQDWFKKRFVQNCISQFPIHQRVAALGACHQRARALRFVVWAFWEVDDNDPGHLRMTIWKSSQDSPKVIIHEYLHWWAHFHSNPHGIIDDHTVVDPMVNIILTSPEFIGWLKEQEQ